MIRIASIIKTFEAGFWHNTSRLSENSPRSEGSSAAGQSVPGLLPRESFQPLIAKHLRC